MLFAEELRKEQGRGRRKTTLVHDVTLEIGTRTALGIVGAAPDSGASALAKMLAGLEAPSSGEARLCGASVAQLLRTPAGRKSFRRRVQYLGSGIATSFDSRRTLAEAVSAPLKTLRGMHAEAEIKERLVTVADELGLEAAWYQLHSTHLSPEELHRFALARALAVEPDVLVLDSFGTDLSECSYAELMGVVRRLAEDREFGLVCVDRSTPAVYPYVREVLVMEAGRIVHRQEVTPIRV